MWVSLWEICDKSNAVRLEQIAKWKPVPKDAGIMGL